MNIIKQAMKEIGLSVAIKLNMAETAQKIVESDPTILNSGHIASAIKSGNIETIDKLLETRGKYGEKFPGTGETVLLKAINDSPDRKFGKIMQTLDKHQFFEQGMSSFSIFDTYASKPYDNSSFNSFLTQSNISSSVATGFLAQSMDGANIGMIQSLASKNLLDINMPLATRIAGSNEPANMTLIGIAANVDNISALTALNQVYENKNKPVTGIDLVAIKDFAFRSQQAYASEILYEKHLSNSIENVPLDTNLDVTKWLGKPFQQHSNIDSPSLHIDRFCTIPTFYEQVPGKRNILKGWTPDNSSYYRPSHWNGYIKEETKSIAKDSQKILSDNENKLTPTDKAVYETIQKDRDLSILENKRLASGNNPENSEMKRILMQINTNAAITVKEKNQELTQEKKPKP